MEIPKKSAMLQQKSTSYTTFYTTRPTTWHYLMLIIPSITGQA